MHQSQKQCGELYGSHAPLKAKVSCCTMVSESMCMLHGPQVCVVLDFYAPEALVFHTHSQREGVFCCTSLYASTPQSPFPCSQRLPSTMSAQRLRDCIERIRAPHAVSLDAALSRVDHMRFSAAERLRFGPGEIHKWHGDKWFPTGLRTLDDVIEHELGHLNASGVTKEMLRSSAACCPYCTHVRIRRSQLTVQGPQEGKMAAALSRIKRLHAEAPLPPFDALLCDRDICRPPELAGGACARSAPILVHAKRQSSLHEVAMPENTFAQSYGGNPPWVENRRRLLESNRAHPWAARSDQIAYYGSGAGYRKFLNYSATASTIGAVLPQLAGVHAHLTTPYTRVPPRHVPMPEQCASKYLVHLGGTWPGFSNKLKQSLACGAVVVMPQNDWYEVGICLVCARSAAVACFYAVVLTVWPTPHGTQFWYLLLSPYEHFVPTRNLALYNGLDWPAVRHCLLAHDDSAARIGAQALRFVQQILTPRTLDVYMRALLNRLSTLQQRGGAVAAEGEDVHTSDTPGPTPGPPKKSVAKKKRPNGLVATSSRLTSLRQIRPSWSVEHALSL